MNKKGNLYVISAPSGAGKGTILKRMMEIDDNLSLSISATTRKPREGELDGVHYHFLTKEQFEDKISKNELLEYAMYADNYYGTPLDYIELQRQEGKDVILEIEVQGASNVREKCPDALGIFITPPSFEELKNRLVGRGTESLETIEKRLKIAKKELLEQVKFDIVVVNDEVERVSNEILDIIKNKR